MFTCTLRQYHIWRKALRKYRRLQRCAIALSHSSGYSAAKLRRAKQRILTLYRRWKIPLATPLLLAWLSSHPGQAQGTLPVSLLNGRNGFTINGSAANDRSGRSVSLLGDLNGDGVDDLIIGAPDANNLAGQSYVVFGNSTGFPAHLNLATLNSNQGFIINGVEESGGLGKSVSGAGDLNGDGVDDLLIGAYNTNGTGRTYVVFGSYDALASIDLTTLNGDHGFVINGINQRDESGYSVSGAGDINGDGLDDLIIGAPYADPNGRDTAGESYVIFGSRGFPAQIDLATLDSTTGFVIPGSNRIDELGISVSTAGDINGDGLNDLIIGAPGADPNGTPKAGESYVIFGSSTFPDSVNLDTLDGTNGLVIAGIDAYDYAGFSVSGAGDVNGDGLDDLIIGAFNADPDGNDYDGQSYVVFGNHSIPARVDLATLDGSNGFIINGADAYARSGFSVSGAGDVNGDGLDDFVIGAPDANLTSNRSVGKSFVVFGRSRFPASVDLATLEVTEGWVITGTEAYDRLGISVSGGGDVNGDGLDDLIIGAPEANPDGKSNAGESYVVFGSTTGFGVPLSIESLTFVRPFDNSDLQPLEEGTVINTDSLFYERFNVRAEVFNPVLDGTLRRVQFELSGPINITRSDFNPPYALFREEDGNYLGRPTLPGTYTLTLTPFVNDGTQVIGEFTTVTFTLEGEQPTATTAELRVYPNVFSEELHMEGIGQNAQIQLFNLQGEAVPLDGKAPLTRKGIRLDTRSVPTGHYFLRISDAQGSQTRHIVKE